jgi:hypothetical protein
LGLLLLVCACSPALNWRDVRAGSGTLTALFPCRPDEQTRTVDLAGQPLKMTLQTCEAQGVLFALASVELSASGAPEPVLAALADGVALKLRGARREAPSVPDQTASSAAGPSGQWSLVGVATDGHERHVELRQFRRGPWVFQATAVANAPIPRETIEPFFGSFPWAP